MGGDNLKYKWFKCHKTSQLNKERIKIVGSDDFTQFVIAFEDYEDACTLVVFYWYEEQDGVSHLRNDNTCNLNFR